MGTQKKGLDTAEQLESVLKAVHFQGLAGPLTHSENFVHVYALGLQHLLDRQGNQHTPRF